MAKKASSDPFLDNDFLQKLEHLALLAKKKARGVNLGEHPSFRSGGSQEFYDYRTYQPGDDLRYVDWNVYGRLGRLFIKLFKAEKEQSIDILLDTSRSMASGSPLKSLYAKQLAAALSYICLSNMDRVRVSAFNEHTVFAKTPERGRQVYFLILEFLRQLKEAGTTHLNASLMELASSVQSNGMVIILSDLLDERGLEQGLKALRSQNLQVNVIQILDSKELFPTLNGFLKLQDLENGTQQELTLDPALRKLYQEKMQEYLHHIEECCHALGGDYFLANTQIPFDQFLIHYFIEGTLIQ